MKGIITGCDGFIGKALAANLINRGVQVISIDRRSGIEAGDYFNSADLSGIDCVFHLAAQTSVFNRNQSDIIHDNIEAFVSVCNACRRYGVKLVYASSSTAAPGNATSLYGISKRFNEDYAQCYCPDATGVRFHNVYGPQPRQGTLLWYMFNDDRVKLYNEGRNVRHFTYIDDIVESLIYASESHTPLLNAVNPEALTTLQVAEIVKQYKPLEIELVRENREFDKAWQVVEKAVITVPLQYIPVSEGIKRIFDGQTQ